MALKSEKRLDCPRCGKMLSPYRVYQIHGNNWRFVCEGISLIDHFFACRWVSGIVPEYYHPRDAIKVDLDGSVEFRKRLVRGELKDERNARRYSDAQV